jgi:iron complex outermembrane receptor protein
MGPVGIYHDGIYLGSNIVHGFPLFDLERVEILRGPQGTLFGRNTTAGLIHYLSRKPEWEDQYNAQVKATYGSFDQLNVEAAVGLPLGNKAAARLSVVSLNRGGLFDNINPDSGFNDAGETDSLAYRGLLRFQPIDSLDLLLNVHGGENQADILPRKQIGLVCPTGSQPGLGSECTDRLGQQDSTDFHESLDNLSTRNDVKTYGTSLEASWDLETVTLTSVTAFEHANLERFSDSDHQPSAQLHSSMASKVDFWSQEIRLASNSAESSQWIVGLNYYQDKLEQWEAFDTNDLFNVLRPGGPLFGTPIPEGIASDLQQQTQSFAVFGEFNYRFWQRWNLTAGLRWTYDRRKIDIEALGWNATTTRNQYVTEEIARENFLLNTIPRSHLENDWNDFSGRIALDYAVNQDQLVFVSASRGFKGGEFNGGALFNIAEATLTNPEFVNSVELGYKGRLWDGRLQLNTSVFYTVFDDQQVFVRAGQNIPLQALVNAGKSEIKGFELEIQLLLSEAWYFRFGAAYLDARFKQFSNQFDPTTNFSGNRLPDAPKWNINGLVQYDWHFALGIVRAQTDFFWNSQQFFTSDNNPIMAQEAYGIVNGRLAFISDKKNYQIAVWAKNILDQEYFTFGSPVEAFGWNILGVGEPRTVGVSFSLSFD